MSEKDEQIVSVLVTIDKTLKKQESFGRVFMQGLVRGFGTALGASILLAIFTSITIRVVDSTDIIHNLIESILVEGA